MLIITIIVVLYYFRGKKIVTGELREGEGKLREEALELTIKSQEAYFRKEIETTQSTQEALFKKDIEAIQYKLNDFHCTIQSEQEAFFKREIEAIQSKLNDSYSTIPILANQQFDEFKKKEVESLRAILNEAASKTALADLESWKIKYEMFYRQDAINRSQSVILGKVTEHLIPFHQNFPFNPKKARFIGSPIDVIVFDGIDNEDIVDVYILEIKTGNPSLSKRQRLIRDAVENNRVFWRELNV